MWWNLIAIRCWKIMLYLVFCNYPKRPCTTWCTIRCTTLDALIYIGYQLLVTTLRNLDVPLNAPLDVPLRPFPTLLYIERNKRKGILSLNIKFNVLRENLNVRTEKNFLWTENLNALRENKIYWAEGNTSRRRAVLTWRDRMGL